MPTPAHPSPHKYHSPHPTTRYQATSYPIPLDMNMGPCVEKVPRGPVCHQPGGKHIGTHKDRAGKSIEVFKCGHDGCDVVVIECPYCLGMHHARHFNEIAAAAKRCKAAHAGLQMYTKHNHDLKHAAHCQGCHTQRTCRPIKVRK